MLRYNRAMQGLRLGTYSILGAALFVTMFGMPSAYAQKEPPPDVPDAIQAPTGEEVILSAHASGSQIYTCQAGADGTFAWTLKGPDAELRDRKDKIIGSHSAGPTWTLKDGSSVTGKAVGHVDSLDSDSVPWLLLTAVSHTGKGALTNVTSIQRIHTRGGKAPAEACDAAHRDTETKSSYTADYYFYAPGGKSGTE